MLGSACATVSKPEAVDQLPPARGGVGMRAAHAAREQHVGLAGQLGEQVEELEHEADAAAPERAQLTLAGARDGLPVDLDRPRLGPVEAAQEVQERRLPRAGAPEDGDDLARLHGQVGAVEDAPRGPALAERLHQPPGHDRGHRTHGKTYAARPAKARRPCTRRA